MAALSILQDQVREAIGRVFRQHMGRPGHPGLEDDIVRGPTSDREAILSVVRLAVGFLRVPRDKRRQR